MFAVSADHGRTLFFSPSDQHRLSSHLIESRRLTHSLVFGTASAIATHRQLASAIIPHSTPLLPSQRLTKSSHFLFTRINIPTAHPFPRARTSSLSFSGSRTFRATNSFTLSRAFSSTILLETHDLKASSLSQSARFNDSLVPPETSPLVSSASATGDQGGRTDVAEAFWWIIIVSAVALLVGLAVVVFIVGYRRTKDKTSATEMMMNHDSFFSTMPFLSSAMSRDSGDEIDHEFANPLADHEEIDSFLNDFHEDPLEALFPFGTTE
jgi:hypothetical protein